MVIAGGNVTIAVIKAAVIAMMVPNNSNNNNNNNNNKHPTRGSPPIMNIRLYRVQAHRGRLFGGQGASISGRGLPLGLTPTCNLKCLQLFQAQPT